jgi:hypothetical protein
VSLGQAAVKGQASLGQAAVKTGWDITTA